MSDQFAIIPARVLKDTRLTNAQLRLLCVLSTFADIDGSCYPLVSTLANACSCSGRTVQRSLRQLQALGYISIHPMYSSKGLQQSNYYVIQYTADTWWNAINREKKFRGRVTQVSGGG